MGEVYRARDTARNRDVALKVLPPAFTADVDRPTFIARRVSWSSDGRSILATVGEGDSHVILERLAAAARE